LDKIDNLEDGVGSDLGAVGVEGGKVKAFCTRMALIVGDAELTALDEHD